MRNTMKYPVTTAECIEAVARTGKEYLDKMRVGDLTPLAMSYVEEYLIGNADFEKWLEERQK